MDAKPTKNMFVRILYIIVILAVALSVTTVVHAAPPSPFIGQWEAIDVDGGDIRVSIGGPRGGPFRITWTEEYFGFCGGGAGIARGTGELDQSDPSVLEAALHLTCFTTGAQVDFYPTWRYDPLTGWMTSQDDGLGGFVTTWHRPGESLPLTWQNFLAHPDQEWVEGMGFPEGTVVSLIIRDPEGTNLFLGSAVAGYPEWDPYNTTARFFLDFDLQAGDHLWMSDGMVAKELMVTNLQITETNLLAKTVSGIAEPDSEVIIEYFPPEAPWVMFSVFADQDGVWTADVPWLTPGLDGLASQADDDGDMTRVAFGVPRLDLRVNYGDDWVESFLPANHTVDITVTDADGNEKGTAQVVTAPREEWGGGEGFQTRPEDWSGGQPPDIQPNDWVYGRMDSGQTAQVQIGEINGTIDLATDSIEGTIDTPWFSSEVDVDCHSWGAPSDIIKSDSVLPDGTDTYSCSWDGEWDVLAGQAIGVGYTGPDGHWVANAFYVPQLLLYIHYEYPDVVEGSYELGHTVQVTVFDSEWNTKATATVNTMEMPHWGGAPGFRVEQWDGIEGPPDIQPGDVVRAVLDDGVLTAETRVGEIAGTIDLDANGITGTINAPGAGDLVTVWCFPWGGPGGAGEKNTTVAPDGISEFTCTWDASEWDIQPGETVGVSYYGDDLHSVANAISNPWIVAFPEANQVFGYGWPVGSEVNLIINDEDIAAVTVQGAPWDATDIMAFFDFGGMHDLVAGDVVILSGSGMERAHTVQNLAVTEVNVEPDTVSGTADTGAVVHAWVHGFGHDVWLTVENGTWSAYFGSEQFHLQPGMCGRTEIRVEGNNSTNVDWCIPKPWLNTFPEWDVIYSYEWPAYSEVNLTINGQFVQTVTVGPASWDPNVYTAYFEFGGLYNLKPDDVVTLSGSGMELTYTVQNLTVTAVDEVEDTVSGTANANAEIVVFPLTTWQQLWVTADGDRNWQVDFTGVFDLASGECVRAEIRDGLSNSTAVDWCIP